MYCVTVRRSSGSVCKPDLAELAQADSLIADCFYPVSHHRLDDLCRTATAADEGMASDRLDRFVHHTCPSLAHFIALTCRPTHLSLPPDVALVVIDSLSALVNHAFPRLPPPKATVKGNNKGQVDVPVRGFIR